MSIAFAVGIGLTVAIFFYQRILSLLYECTKAYRPSCQLGLRAPSDALVQGYILFFRHPTMSTKALYFSLLSCSIVLSSVRSFTCSPVCPVLLLPLYPMNGLNSFDKADRKYSIALHWWSLNACHYSLGALVLTQSKVKDLGVCWNDCFRKIFKYNRWESVSELQQCCGEPSFQCIYNKSRMNFRNSANALKIVWFVQQLTFM